VETRWAKVKRWFRNVGRWFAEGLVDAWLGDGDDFNGERR
jgi:hypothetical protein